MGRNSTGAINTGECLRLNIKNFTKEIKLKRGGSSSLSWTNGSSISLRLTYPNELPTLTLIYTNTDWQGNKRELNYNVMIVGMPSNLGKGLVYYFLCPFTYKKCKILYKGYGSLYFKSRESYSHRIYYPCQLSSRLDKHNDKYWNLQQKLEKLYKKYTKSHYRGQKTVKQLRIERLEAKQNFHDQMRWRIMPASLMKHLGGKGIEF